MGIYILTLALWLSPPVALAFIWFFFTKRTRLRKHFLIGCATLSLFTIIGISTGISTTLIEVDWFLVGFIYFTISCFLIATQFQKNKFIKTTGVISMSIVFAIGYFSSTAGWLGLGFVLHELDTDAEVWLDSETIYKETILGNAISDYRGKEVRICKTISWFPVIEWTVERKQYFNLITCLNRLQPVYNSQAQVVYLSASTTWGSNDSLVYWHDTLKIR